jgi:hypothetical protein
MQAMKFTIMQISPWSVFLPFRSKYPPQYSLLKNLQSIFSLRLRDQVSTSGKIRFFYILIFKFFDTRQEDKRFWIE